MNRKQTGLAAMVLGLAIAMTAALGSLLPTTAYAKAQWPSMSSIEAEGGILVDARTGTVLFAKNADQQFYPASITKILTALLVIENCDDLDAEFAFSHRAIYDVETNSQNAGYDEGDVISVRDALYAMLLQSANEVANGLAEYVGGSIEGFADMMNEYAASIGCTNSHFANPSGLNNPEHYTTASDYAKICIRAFENETFREIDGTTYYKLPASKRNPEGFTVYTHHGMLKKNNENYYPDAIGGKTGYTSLAGNTLVTCAEKDGLRLITVILNGHQTHYSDTKAMLNFGFASFKSLRVREYEADYAQVYDVLDITSEGVEGTDILAAQEDASVIVPMDADFDDLDKTWSYSLDKTASENVPEGAVARITYAYDGRTVGYDYLTADLSTPEAESTAAGESGAGEGSVAGESSAAGGGSAAGESTPVGDNNGSQVSGGDASAAGGDIVAEADKNGTESSGASNTDAGDAKTQKQDDKSSAGRTIAIAAGVLVAIAGIAALAVYLIRKKKDDDMSVGPRSTSGATRVRGRSRRRRR